MNLSRPTERTADAPEPTSSRTATADRNLAAATESDASTRAQQAELQAKMLAEAKAAAQQRETARRRLEEQRQRRAQEAIAKHLGMPIATELDIEVDLGAEQAVTFLVRDRRTGKLVRRIPEPEASGLFAALRRENSSLVDRAL
ncbi:MAG: hypothetical protein RL398_377 [Planctomycetota bacterium]